MDLIAWYGAVVGTAALGLSVYMARRDRARVKFELRFGFATIPLPLSGWTITATVYNHGRRPVTIPPMMYCDVADGDHMKVCLDFSNGTAAVEIAEGKNYVWALPFESFVHWPKEHRGRFWVEDALGRRHHAKMPPALWVAVDDPERFDRMIKGRISGSSLSIILYPPASGDSGVG